MSVRRKTDFRLTLIRSCGTCGREFVTSAASPWMRQLPRDGKKQAITYFCSESCYAKSYKHIGFYDGKAAERRAEREAKRDNRERCRIYNAKNAEKRRQKRREWYWANHDEAILRNKYNRQKRKLLLQSATEQSEVKNA